MAKDSVSYSADADCVDDEKAVLIDEIVCADTPEHPQEVKGSLEWASEQVILRRARERICNAGAPVPARWLRQDKRSIWALLPLAIPTSLFLVALMFLTVGKEGAVMRGCYSRYEGAHHHSVTMTTTDLCNLSPAQDTFCLIEPLLWHCCVYKLKQGVCWGFLQHVACERRDRVSFSQCASSATQFVILSIRGARAGCMHRLATTQPGVTSQQLQQIMTPRRDFMATSIVRKSISASNWAQECGKDSAPNPSALEPAQKPWYCTCVQVCCQNATVRHRPG